MNHEHSPAEIARETLKRLAARHLPPTPENFQSCYHEIADIPSKAPFPEAQLRHLMAALVAHNEAQRKQLSILGVAITRHSWQGVEKSLIAFLDAVGGDSATSDSIPTESLSLPTEFCEKLARFVESMVKHFGDENGSLFATAESLTLALRSPQVDLKLTQDLLINLSHQAFTSTDEQTQVGQSLLKLLQLIIENIGELTLDESWLKGQIDGLLAAIEPPVTLRHLDDMERCLREVIRKQSEAKRQSVEAQEEMRKMLTAFVASLSTMNASSTTFQKTIEASASKINKVKKIEDLGPLLEGVIEATRSMAEETSRTRDKLQDMQKKVEATEATLVRLYEELDNASSQARHDPLTDALNRKGLDDAMNREIASIRRRKVPLSVCMLDIDNFKKLNDRLGHETGDKALTHLAGVARHCMRPNDTLARYGGEEFVILMPDTTLEDGIEAMVRLQRELTKRFFLADTERILITFSAGVTQVLADESGQEAINRADRAMYLAKRAGKNRVVGG